MINIKKRLAVIALAAMTCTTVMPTALSTPAQAKGISGWKHDGYNQWRYVNAWFEDVTGWEQIGGNWYYFNSNGLMLEDWQKIDGSWYFLGEDGEMRTGWVKDYGHWYYMNSDGSMATGWKHIDNQWYYFFSNGSMAHNCSVGGYYLCSEGYWNE